MTKGSKVPKIRGLNASIEVSDILSIYMTDCILGMRLLPEESVDLIFADPPYFLSNDGFTCHSGKRVSVNKGKWDKNPGLEKMHEFNLLWLSEAKRCLTKNGTIWISGTPHVIYSVGFGLQQLDYKLLNHITWVKPNPPPNLSCRYFTHAAEEILWAAKDKKSKHIFNYEEMRAENGGKQMKSVWEIYPPAKEEKKYGKHPAQKPLALLDRIIRASSNKGDLIMDPFIGSGTTAIAALRTGRRFIGFELEDKFIKLCKLRIEDEERSLFVARDNYLQNKFNKKTKTINV